MSKADLLRRYLSLQPDLSPRELAGRVGCSVALVYYVRRFQPQPRQERPETMPLVLPALCVVAGCPNPLSRTLRGYCKYHGYKMRRGH